MAIFLRHSVCCYIRQHLTYNLASHWWFQARFLLFLGWLAGTMAIVAT